MFITFLFNVTILVFHIAGTENVEDPKLPTIVEKDLVKCKHCSESIKNIDLDIHLVTKHPDAFKGTSSKKSCPCCDQRASFRWRTKYMSQVDDKKYECKFCSEVLTMPPGLFKNMRRHFQRKHSKLYEKEVKDCKKKFCYIFVPKKSNIIKIEKDDKVRKIGVKVEKIDVKDKKDDKNTKINVKDKNSDVIEKINKVENKKNDDTSGKNQLKPTKPFIGNLKQQRHQEWIKDYLEKIYATRVKCSLCTTNLRPGEFKKHLEQHHRRTLNPAMLLNKPCAMEKKLFFKK